MRNREVSTDSEELNLARKKKRQHKLMLDTINDVVSYLLYILLLIAAANTAKNPQAFIFHSSISNIFLMEGEPVFNEVSQLG